MPLSPRFIEEILKERSTDTEILLITISHHSWDDDLRLTTSDKDLLFMHEETNRPVSGVKSRGKEYMFAGLNVILPSSQDEQAPEASFSFSTVSQEISAKLKMVDATYPRMTLELVSYDYPDEVEMVYPDLLINSADWDRLEGKVTVVHDAQNNEACSPWRFNRAEFPNLFI